MWRQLWTRVTLMPSSILQMSSWIKCIAPRGGGWERGKRSDRCQLADSSCFGDAAQMWWCRRHTGKKCALDRMAANCGKVISLWGYAIYLMSSTHYRHYLAAFPQQELSPGTIGAFVFPLLGPGSKMSSREIFFNPPPKVPARRVVQGPFGKSPCSRMKPGSLL